jgi:hypothetical protein
MKQVDAETELKKRIYQWALETIKRELISNFSVLRQCQHERRIRCFLEWMKDTPDDRRLAICLSLAKQANRQVLVNGDTITSFDEEIEVAYEKAYCYYHESLPPTPNSDRKAEEFVKADLKRARDLIADELVHSFGQPTKRPKRSLWYMRHHGDWILKTIVQLRSPFGSGQVECYHFIWRSDFKYDTQPDDLFRKIDPVAKMGVWISRFSLLSVAEEQLAAQAVCAVMEMFVPAFPTMVTDLD